MKPLDVSDPANDDIKSVTLFVEPDRLSALVVLANYTEPDLENKAVPWAAGCQIMGIFAYRELERDHPRALVGLTDLSARLNVRASLGKNVLSFTMPWPLFLQMEQNVEGSFLQRRTWANSIATEVLGRGSGRDQVAPCEFCSFRQQTMQAPLCPCHWVSPV